MIEITFDPTNVLLTGRSRAVDHIKIGGDTLTMTFEGAKSLLRELDAAIRHYENDRPIH